MHWSDKAPVNATFPALYVTTGLEYCQSNECFRATAAPTPGPTPAPTPAPTPCPASSTATVDVQINTDNYPSETGFTLMNMCTSTMVGEMVAGTYTAAGAAYTESYCVPENTQFSFTITDTYGDGICCGYGTGSYSIYYSSSGETKGSPSGGAFGSSETVLIGTCGGGPNTPSPTGQPTPSPTQVRMINFCKFY